MATTTKNMTKAQAFAIALEVLENSAHPEKADAMAKISKEIENLQKKSAGNGKPTKTQIENANIAQEMLDFMVAGHPYTISELSKTCPAVLNATPQKIRPLLSGLIKANAVERTEEKGKPMFTKIAVED